jgi:dihydrofolate synthase/folylpolyglutamate synthase
MKIECIEDVDRYLENIPPFKEKGKGAANFSLQRFREYCAEAGDPQDKFPSIHVAGSNGKGSTCQMITSMYCKAGYNVGLFTSPHLLAYNERFTINGKEISDAELILFFQQFGSLMRRYRLTYFEVAAAAAFWWFARRAVDIAVIETGLGGRLDATNIIDPAAVVITTITYDHLNILGNTIEEITAEKAGIIKEGVPVVLGNVPDKAHPVINKKAQKLRAPVMDSLSYHPVYENGDYYLTAGGEQICLQTTLKTPVQAYNIAAAWGLTEVLRPQFPINEQQRREGVRDVENLFTRTARFESIHPQFCWYFDGAHNLQAIRAMKKTIETRQSVQETILILSLMKDKILKRMMTEFLDFKKIYYYSLSLERAASLEDIQQWLPNVQSFPVEDQARNHFLEEVESKLVIFAGSFYFYPTVVDWMSDYMEWP